jgi:hypothetical protein
LQNPLIRGRFNRISVLKNPGDEEEKEEEEEEDDEENIKNDMGEKDEEESSKALEETIETFFPFVTNLNLSQSALNKSFPFFSNQAFSMITLYAFWAGAVYLLLSLCSDSSSTSL